MADHNTLARSRTERIAEGRVRDGDDYRAKGDEARAKQCYFDAAVHWKEQFDDDTAAGRDEFTRAITARAAATLFMMADMPRVAEEVAMKAYVATPSKYVETRAELRELIRLAWKMQKFTAKSDRATADAFVVQRRRLRAILRPPRAKGA